jgi:hypothetical protein
MTKAETKLHVDYSYKGETGKKRQAISLYGRQNVLIMQGALL